MVAKADKSNKPKPGNRCPICSEPTDDSQSTFPFCSDRCKKIDLGKWLDGKYLISRPIEQSDQDEG